MNLLQSPTIAVVMVSYSDKGAYESELASMRIPHSLNIVPLYSPMSEIYPINTLRNIAISKVKTSHFIIADIDTWPSGRN